MPYGPLGVKGSGPNSVTHLEWTCLFEWRVVKDGSKNGHQKDMYVREIWLQAHDLLIVLGSIVNLIRRTYKIIQLRGKKC